MWLLRDRDPVRYGKWRSRTEVEQHADGPALVLATRILDLIRDAHELRPERLSGFGESADVPGDAP